MNSASSGLRPDEIGRVIAETDSAAKAVQSNHKRREAIISILDVLCAERCDEGIAHKLCECGYPRASLVDWCAPLAATPRSNTAASPRKCADHCLPCRNARCRTDGASATSLRKEQAAAHAQRA
jgi:hypothetical protein